MKSPSTKATKSKPVPLPKRRKVRGEPEPEVQPKSTGDFQQKPAKPPPKYKELLGSRGTAGTQQSALDVTYQPPSPAEVKQPLAVVNSDRPVERTLFSGGKIVSVYELSAMFGISTRTLWRRAVQQEWPRIPLGQTIRFDLELVLRHIERVERYDQPPPLRGLTLFFDTVFPALEGSHTYVVGGVSFVFPGKYVELRAIGELVTSEPQCWKEVEVWADERVLLSIPEPLHPVVLRITVPPTWRKPILQQNEENPLPSAVESPLSRLELDDDLYNPQGEPLS